MGFYQVLKNKLISKEDALRIINTKKLLGKKVVFTNGCFDILHPGHVDYLNKARDLGDFLVLGLNTDNSVKLLNKAPNRPINNELDRAHVLAGLSCVDCIVLFDVETPLELIKYLNPNVLVKGDDYEVEKIVGYDFIKLNGGKVATIPFLEGYSTTQLIKNILR
ncbi:MAG: D-glycero-beta-D-manno-heptose 1-phosphate adenylyltransferase [Bacteroidota bacterium]|nr:D-glycero-beta-D-manno-heptose 1-phosphate adenylyltransferase [Bacteroidota bacterium]